EIVNPGENGKPFGNRKNPSKSAPAPENPLTHGPYMTANKIVGINVKLTLKNCVSTAKKRVRTTLIAIIRPMTAMSLAEKRRDEIFFIYSNSFLESLRNYAANARTRPPARP